MKPTRKQLENLVRNEHISANKLNVQLVSKGWMKYGEFESKIKKELGIGGNMLKKAHGGVPLYVYFAISTFSINL